MLIACSTRDATAQFEQQGAKLVGTGALGGASQGWAVSLSSDGNSALVGGFTDHDYAGAAWYFTREGGAWTQQGGKLVGDAASGAAFQGSSVAISGDGLTALLGGPSDHYPVGAAWLFAHEPDGWHQQGGKIYPLDALGGAYFGCSSALSADGNTAIVGGYIENSLVGAAWVFSRSNGLWSQQGDKLVGADRVGPPMQGVSVAISADGNTAVVGGWDDDGGKGAAWVYARSGGVWSQQGPKLVGTGAVGAALQGSSIAISGDGNTILVGGCYDAGTMGAAWVFTRASGVWTQQGSKLVGAGAAGTAFQGSAVALSFDGNTALVGGTEDGDHAGAVWVFKRRLGKWSPFGAKLVASGAAGTAYLGSAVALSADGRTALVGGFHDGGGAGAAWVFVNPNRGRAPDVSLAVAEPSSLWPANHKLTPILITGVTDPDGDDVTVRVDRVTQDEPLGSGDAVPASPLTTMVRSAPAASIGHGDAGDGGGGILVRDPAAAGCADAVIDADGVAWVRAERAEEGNGRVYTLWFTARDPDGHATQGAVTVGVPHDTAHPDAVDDGQIFDSTGPCDGALAAGGRGVLAAATVRAPLGTGAAPVLDYALSTAADVTVDLYDVGGRRVATLASAWQGAGAHTLAWDAASGATRAPAGVYFLRIQAGREQLVRRVVVVR